MISTPSSPSPSLLVLPDGPGGRVGRLRTVTAMPMGRTAPPAPIGTVVRVSLRAPAGARPLVCAQPVERVTRCRISCRLPRGDARPDESMDGRPPIDVLNVGILAMNSKCSLCQ